MDALTEFKKRLQIYVHAMVQSGKMSPVIAKATTTFFSTTAAGDLKNRIGEFHETFPAYMYQIDSIYMISKIDEIRMILATHILSSVTDANLDAVLDQVKKLMVLLNE